MIDFASTLYLGMQHPSSETGGYDALTTGTPASLAASPLSGEVAAQAAVLQGCEAGMVAPSTLHLSIDLFDRLGRSHAIIADEALYPVMRWGLERIKGLGVPVAWFRHGDPADLARQMRQLPRARPPAVIVDATGIEGSPTPIGRYLAIVQRHRGLLAIDQSQTLGLLGALALAHRIRGDAVAAACCATRTSLRRHPCCCSPRGRRHLARHSPRSAAPPPW